MCILSTIPPPELSFDFSTQVSFLDAAMLPYMLFIFATAYGCVWATPSPANKALCTDLWIPLKITAPALIPSFPPFNGSTEATNFVLTVLAGGIVPFTGVTENITGLYTISAQFCTPTKPSARSTKVQIMTHGIRLDKRYALSFSPQVR
jgi:hypothetical protein